MVTLCVSCYKMQTDDPPRLLTYEVWSKYTLEERNKARLDTFTRSKDALKAIEKRLKDRTWKRHFKRMHTSIRHWAVQGFTDEDHEYRVIGKGFRVMFSLFDVHQGLKEEDDVGIFNKDEEELIVTIAREFGALYY